MTAERTGYWVADCLERQPDCELFADYLISRARQRLERGVGDGSFVVGVRGPYGAGKTFFLRGLEQMLSEQHPVAYLDAWESDSLGDPLMALIDALERALDAFVEAPHTSDKVKALASNFGKLSFAALKGAGKALGQRYLGHELGEVISEVTQISSGDRVRDAENAQAVADATGDALAKQAENYRSTVRSLIDRATARRKATWDEAKLGLIHLRKALVEIVSILREAEDLATPIVIIVDELDRCRPNYAVSMLEEIKHFFAVPGIVFVLGMERDQLAKSISGVYGSEFNGDEYLQRFTQFDYSIPEAPMLAFVTRRLEEDPLEEKAFAPDIAGDTLAGELARFFQTMGCPPRQADQVLESIRIASKVKSIRWALSATLLATLAHEGITKKLVKDRVDPKRSNIDNAVQLRTDHLLGPKTSPWHLILCLRGCTPDGVRHARNVDSSGNLSSLTGQPQDFVDYYLFKVTMERLSDPVQEHEQLLTRVAGFTS